jgi:hypothetical protein
MLTHDHSIVHAGHESSSALLAHQLTAGGGTGKYAEAGNQLRPHYPKYYLVLFFQWTSNEESLINAILAQQQNGGQYGDSMSCMFSN